MLRIKKNTLYVLRPAWDQKNTAMVVKDIVNYRFKKTTTNSKNNV